MDQEVPASHNHSVRLSPGDLYRLRRARLRLERAALRARFAQQLLEELTLDLERRYALLATDNWLDPSTGRVSPSTPLRTGPSAGSGQAPMADQPFSGRATTPIPETRHDP